MGYLLSIVVPTKDRYFYLKHLIELIKSFNSDDIELIIQDNTSNNTEIINYLDNLDFPHLKYYYTKEQISVSENSTKAIQHSTGEFVCFIGDDDGVSRHILECVRWMKEHSIDVLECERALYKWPTFPNGRMKLSSTLALSNYTWKYKMIETKKALKKLLQTGITGLTAMPKVYHGIVKRSTLDKIYEKTGTYFPGSSPDMGNAVALCFVSNSYAYMDAPIIIGGICGSGGGDIMNIKKGYKELNEVTFLPKGIEDRWYSGLPNVWLNETIWPQSAIEGLRNMGEELYLKYIDDSQLQAKIIMSHPNLRERTLSISKQPQRVNMLVLKYKIERKMRNAKYLAMYYMFDKFMGCMKLHRNINTIIDAEKLIMEKYPCFYVRG